MSPMVSEPREYPVLRRIFTRKTLISALILSVMAETLCGICIFYLPAGCSFLYVCGFFHIPGIIVASLLVPDGFDDYATKNQELVGDWIVVAIGWVQWFVIDGVADFGTSNAPVQLLVPILSSEISRLMKQ